MWERNLPCLLFAKCLPHLEKNTAQWFAVFRVFSEFRKCLSSPVKYRQLVFPSLLMKDNCLPSNQIFLSLLGRNLPYVLFAKCLPHLGIKTANCICRHIFFHYDLIVKHKFLLLHEANFSFSSREENWPIIHLKLLSFLI